MISARRAASLGLWVPLSAIMSAVLGLWPEPEEDEPALPQVYGSGRKRWGGKPWPAIVWRARPGRAEPRRPIHEDEALDDQVRRAWDEIDALRRQAPAADAPAPAPVIGAGAPQTLSFSAPQPPDALPDARAPDSHATATRGDARARDDDALIALMVAELA